MASNVWRSLPGSLQWLVKVIMLSNEQGAEAPLFCVTAPELGAVSGRHYNRCREARSNPLVDDPLRGRELWDRSESAVS